MERANYVRAIGVRHYILQCICVYENKRYQSKQNYKKNIIKKPNRRKRRKDR